MAKIELAVNGLFDRALWHLAYGWQQEPMRRFKKPGSWLLVCSVMIAEKAANTVWYLNLEGRHTVQQSNTIFYSNLRGIAKCTSDRAKSLTSHWVCFIQTCQIIEDLAFRPSVRIRNGFAM